MSGHTPEKVGWIGVQVVLSLRTFSLEFGFLNVTLFRGKESIDFFKESPDLNRRHASSFYFDFLYE